MKDDPETKCGWRWFTIWKNPKDDPYYSACVAHDQSTEDGAPKSTRQANEEFAGDVERIRQVRYSGLGAYRVLSVFYRLVTKGVTWIFK